MKKKEFNIREKKNKVDAEQKCKPLLRDIIFFCFKYIFHVHLFRFRRIVTIFTHMSLAWSVVCLSVTYRDTYFLLEPFDRFVGYLVDKLAGFGDTLF